MADYVSNCPISRPRRVAGVTPDLDLNGIMWSHRYGLIYYPDTDFTPIQPPSPATNPSLIK